MRSDTWLSALKGFAISAVFTLIVYGAAKYAVDFVAGPMAEQYRAETGAKAPIGDWYYDGREMFADVILPELLLLFVIHWLLIAIFSKGKKLHSPISFFLLVLGIACSLSLIFNNYFDLIDSYCYPEALMLHEGFQITKIYECPSSHIFFQGVSRASLFFVVMSAILGSLQSRKRLRQQ